MHSRRSRRHYGLSALPPPPRMRFSGRRVLWSLAMSVIGWAFITAALIGIAMLAGLVR